MMLTDTLQMHTIGGALYVYVDIWNSNEQDFSTALLTFDTGATVTTISSTVIDALGYDISNGKKQIITTDSGVAIVQEITVDKLKIGTSHTLDDVKVYVHDFPDESFTIGVIGFNVLSQFDMMLSFSSKLINFVKY